MLSICVTYYNQEKYVSRSLDSIFAQNLKSDFEVLIGDDGSQDGTVKVVEEYQKKYPDKLKLYIMPREPESNYLSVERASLNRLNLLQNASGNYICFLDGDDSYCDYSFMQAAIDDLDQDNTIIGVAHNYITVNTDKNEYHENLIYKKYIELKDYVYSMYIHVGAIVFRCPEKKELERNIRLHAFDDNDITYFFLNKGKLLYKNVNVYNYYSNADSICSSINTFEMKLLNAISYELLKQLIDSKHFQLFFRYFDTIFFVYKNRKELKTGKYEKWIKWCKDINLNLKILNLDNKCIAYRIFYSFYMHLIYILEHLYYKFFNVIHKIKHLYNRLVRN